jgi:hypothetical protein
MKKAYNSGQNTSNTQKKHGLAPWAIKDEKPPKRL